MLTRVGRKGINRLLRGSRGEFVKMANGGDVFPSSMTELPTIHFIFGAGNISGDVQRAPSLNEKLLLCDGNKICLFSVLEISQKHVIWLQDVHGIEKNVPRTLNLNSSQAFKDSCSLREIPFVQWRIVTSILAVLQHSIIYHLIE